MNAVIAELKKAREARKMSVGDIAAATLINVQMLEEIEQGNLSVLPQAYVRAFLREYASTVGLDPDAIMKEYDRETETPAEKPEVAPPQPSLTPIDEKSSSRTVTVGALIAIASLILVAAWYVFRPDPESSVQEIPFQSIVQDNEQRLNLDTLGRSTHPVKTAAAGAADSMTLMATTSDTVWMQLVIDQGEPLEYLFRPHATRSWRAQHRFVVTLGNAGGVDLTLNDKRLGHLGKPGVVIRDVELTRDSLKRD